MESHDYHFADLRLPPPAHATAHFHAILMLPIFTQVCTMKISLDTEGGHGRDHSDFLLQVLSKCKVVNKEEYDALSKDVIGEQNPNASRPRPVLTCLGIPWFRRGE